MPAEQFQRLRLIPQLDLPDQFGFSVPAGEVPLHDFDRGDTHGQVVGKRMNRHQAAMLVVELPDIGVREARDGAHRRVSGDPGPGLALLVADLERRLNVKSG